MAQLPTSGIPLFRLFGIQVSLHWTWFIIVYIAVQQRAGQYTTPIWPVIEVLSLFAIVLTHEFGHALACRSVGGRAEHIMLWPLGGVAFVDPPPRPGAVLWSIAAGPLVNVILLPMTLWVLIASGAWAALWQRNPINDLQMLFVAIAVANAGLLVFNMLPIYPLDGGQTLRALLWFFIGPVRSLMIASFIGLVGAGVGVLLAMWMQSVWLVVIALFAAMQSWAGFQYSKRMRAVLDIPRRSDAFCPACSMPPMRDVQLKCDCGEAYDVFLNSRCRHCGRVASSIRCPDCGQVSDPALWHAAATVLSPAGNRPA